jgi:hypothetical protein
MNKRQVYFFFLIVRFSKCWDDGDGTRCDMLKKQRRVLFNKLNIFYTINALSEVQKVTIDFYICVQYVLAFLPL